MPKILCVYINGTDESADFPHNGIVSLANLLHHLTDQNGKTTASICLNGCGISNRDIRDFGAIFTWHLEKQINALVKKIQSDYLKENDKLTLNIYGFSRGGVAAFLLCKKLKHISSKQLEINVLSFEPVPGNIITSTYADKLLGLDTTLASIVGDLRDCKNINRMQVLFTNKPLPDITCHGPILPIMPSCDLTIDVVPGCHKGSELFFKSGDSIVPYNNESAIAFHQVVNFLQKCGTVFDFSKLKLNERLKIEDTKTLSELFNRKLSKTEPTTRSMHFSNTLFAKPGIGKHLNCYHQSLSGAAVDPDKCVLGIKDRHPTPIFRDAQRNAARVIVPVLLFSAALLYKKLSNSLGATDNENTSGLTNFM